MKRALALFLLLVTWAGAAALAGTSANAATRPSGRAAALRAGGPSGIGIRAGGPKVSSNAALYARALKSRSWLRTPDGLEFHACVHQIPRGATLDTIHSKIILASGAVRSFASCRYPRLIRPGQARSQARAQARPAVAPTTGGWLQASWWNAPTWLTSLSVRYALPTAPTVSGATDYLFSSFEDAAGDSIIQPVIGYGSTAASGKPSTGAIGGNLMWMDSYYVWGANNVAAGFLYRETPGDTIAGTMTASSCNSSGGGCTWAIRTTDTNNGNASSISVVSSPSYVSAQGGVLESYGASGCNMLFANHHGVFRSIAIDTHGAAPATPAFQHEVFDQECGMSMNISATSADILWTP